MRSLRFAVTLAAASLLVAASVGIASAAPTVKVASRGLEQRIGTFWTNLPTQPSQTVTYTEAYVDGYAWYAIQAGSGYAPTGPVMSADSWVHIIQYHLDGSVRHVTFDGYGAGPGIPSVDMGLTYGTTSAFVPGFGNVRVGCAGYGALMRSSWTWTGGYQPNYGWTQVAVGQVRACVPALAVNGVTQPGTSWRSNGSIGVFTVTQVAVYPK